MLKCATCKKLVGKLGDMHECIGGEFRFCTAGGPVAPDAAAAPSPSIVMTGWATGPAIQAGDRITVSVPAQYRAPAKQRGGRFTVNGWLALALVALAALQAATIVHLLRHRTMVIVMPEHTQMEQEAPSQGPAPPVTHTEQFFNYSTDSSVPVCGLFDNICWTNI